MAEQQIPQDNRKYAGLESTLLDEYNLESKRRSESDNPSRLTERQYEEIMFQATLIQNAKETDKIQEIIDRRNIRRMREAANDRSRAYIEHDQLYSRRKDLGIKRAEYIDLASSLVLGYRTSYKEKKSLKEKMKIAGSITKHLLKSGFYGALVFPTHFRKCASDSYGRFGESSGENIFTWTGFYLGIFTNILGYHLANSINPELGIRYLSAITATNLGSLAYEITRAVRKSREKNLREKLEMEVDNQKD